MIKAKPEMAEKMISLPSFSFSGLPEEVSILILPQTISKKAIPPPIMTEFLKIQETKRAGLVGIKPKPVSRQSV